MYKVTTYLNEDRFPYLVKEKCNYGKDNDYKYDDPEKVWELCKAMRITERANEMVLLLVFDAANHLICISEISTGTATGSIMPTRELCQTMLLSAGVGAILVHNHPSSDTEPSTQDICVTKKVKAAFDVLGLQLFDHIIVGRNMYQNMYKVHHIIQRV